MDDPFRKFDTSPGIIRLAMLIDVRFPLSLRNVEDLLHERGIDISHVTVRFWWMRFGPLIAREIKKRRSQRLHRVIQWRWRLDQVFVKVSGETRHLRGRWTTKARCWSLMSPRPGISRLGLSLEGSDETLRSGSGGRD